MLLYNDQPMPVASSHSPFVACALVPIVACALVAIVADTAVRQFAQSSMRSAIGELELDEILHARKRLNDMIGNAVQDAAAAWGLAVKR